MRDKSKAPLLRTIDSFTRLQGVCQLTDEQMNEAVCLAALVGAGMHVEAEHVAVAGKINRMDALASIGMLLLANIDKCGKEVTRAIVRMERKAK